MMNGFDGMGAWGMFTGTGNIGYYLLYRALNDMDEKERLTAGEDPLRR
ncbi:MAG: YqzL family protein [Clostridia bacterium]|nr:YqzL family protein [Clostridia bacterium]